MLNSTAEYFQDQDNKANQSIIVAEMLNRTMDVMLLDNFPFRNLSAMSQFGEIFEIHRRDRTRIVIDNSILVTVIISREYQLSTNETSINLKIILH